MKKDLLVVKISNSRYDMGRTAALDIREKMIELLEQKAEISMIFAAAPSQNEVLEQLISFKDIDWTRIHAYHMDEYIGLSANDSDKCFGHFLRERIFDKVPFKSVQLINGNAEDTETECERYARLLRANPADIVVMGIGENGHIAFNDPGVADFSDSKTVKVVALDEMCRMQQVNDGCFPCLDRVPRYALTLTCPALFSGKHLFCIVPAKSKAEAVKHTLCDDISEACPATILRKHGSAVLYLDNDSSSLLNI